MSFKIIISCNPLVLIEYLAVSKNGEISLPIFKIVVTLYKVRKPGLRKLMWHDLIKRVCECVCMCVRAHAHVVYTLMLTYTQKTVWRYIPRYYNSNGFLCEILL